MSLCTKQPAEQRSVLLVTHFGNSIFLIIYPQNKEGFPPSEFRLTVGSRHLNDDEIISESTIRNDSTVEVKFSLIGGSTGSLGQDIFDSKKKQVMTPLRDFPTGQFSLIRVYLV